MAGPREERESSLLREEVLERCSERQPDWFCLPLSFILTRSFEISLALNFWLDFGVQVRLFHVIRAL